MKILMCSLAVVASLVAVRAEADVSKAWAAAKDNLPASAEAVGAIDVAAVVKGPAFGKLVARFFGMDPKIETEFKKLTKACAFDPTTAVAGVVIAGTPTHDQGVVFVQLAVDRAKATACIEHAFQAAVGGKPKTKADGIYTSFQGIHVAWVASDVLAISLDPDDRAKLDAWIGKKGAFGKTGVAAQIAKVDTKAAAWGAFAFSKQLDRDMPVLHGYGAVTVASGAISGTIRATFVDRQGATATLAEIEKQFAKEAKRKRTPESIKKVMKAIKLSTSNAEIVAKGSLAESDLLDALFDAIGN